MKFSIALQAAWELAANEAIVAEYREIEPEHMFEAILKMTEIPIYQFTKMLSDERLAHQVTIELEYVCHEIYERKINQKEVRHKLRDSMGKGGCKYAGGAIHRSQALKTMFNEAENSQKADSNELGLGHLFKTLINSPTPLMDRVLGQSTREPTQNINKESFLIAYGKNLIAEALAANLPFNEKRVIEAKALIDVLSDNKRRSIWLVCESESFSDAVLAATANIIASYGKKDEQKIKQLLSIITNDQNLETFKYRSLLESIFKDAHSLENVVLILHSKESTGDVLATFEIAETIINSIVENSLQVICQIRPNTLLHLKATDVRWKRHFTAIHIRNTISSEIPDKI